MEFTHLDERGQAKMVGISDKQITHRTAKARAKIQFPADIYAKIKSNNGQTAKGSIEGTARIAGIMAAKKTSDLIPLCHPLPLEKCQIDFEFEDSSNSIIIFASTQVCHKTGIEMEALTAASVAALTIYDMCKALSQDMQITEIRLLEKTGGKTDVKFAQ